MDRWRSRSRVPLLILALLGCSFDADGLGESAGDADGASGGESEAGSESAPGTSSGSDSSGSSSASSSTASSGNSTSTSTSTSDPTEGADGPLLQISDAPSYDYGPVDLGENASHTFTVTNVGGQQATSVVPDDLAAPFSYGTTNCGATLAPSEMCTLEVLASPSSFGDVAGTLSVDYGPMNASAAVDVTATGAGTTNNLLINGDAESGGAPPMGWTEVAGDTWESGDYSGTDGIPSHGGQNAIFGGRDASGDGELAQTVDLTEWSEFIDAGEVEVNFDGWARSYFSGSDPYAILVEFLDDQGQVVGDELVDTGFLLGTTWTQYPQSAVPPTQARAVRVRLFCQLSGIWCDVFFDDLVISLTYVG